MKELHANRLTLKDGEQSFGIHAVSRYESFQDVEALGCDDVDTPVLEKIRRGLGSIFNEASVHKVLCHAFRHVAGH